MKKYIANVITGSRIVCSLPLLFIPLSSLWFYALYLFCGFSDMIDGAIARRTGAVSKRGARLDTAADLVFMLVCCVKILPRVNLSAWIWVWISIIALIKIFNLALFLIQKKRLLSVHSVLNKAVGFLLFLFPLSLNFVEATYTASVICVLAVLAVMQEIYITAKGQEIL